MVVGPDPPIFLNIILINKGVRSNTHSTYFKKIPFYPLNEKSTFHYIIEQPYSMITLKTTTTKFILYKNLIDGGILPEGATIRLVNSIDGDEMDLVYTIIEEVNNYTITFEPVELFSGHYMLEVLDGSEEVYKEKVIFNV